MYRALAGTNIREYTALNRQSLRRQECGWR
jgi:hypothetical protein